MAFRYIFVISALVVLAQGSYLSSVNHEAVVGVHHSGVLSAGAPVGGAQPHRPQAQRPGAGHGSLGGPVGGARRVSGAGVAGPRSHGGAVRRPSAGAHGRPLGGASAHGNAHQGRNRNQKPY
ncbi:translation initiation factor IF-2-like [Drosophila eugracilis]|uniref:translation initiation factor IF-2-like n=1 Tax=Drosophila eugracilis TaxID=29029 RepID=UPI0007E8925A|nr:translation initiation factor IF-2-like [Drosophila eugracilis]